MLNGGSLLFYLYQSNHIENLAVSLAGVVAAPLRSPLAPEVVIVQGKGMERWVSLRLAERLTICANVEFLSPSAFERRMVCAVSGDLSDSSTFSPEVLVWRIMACLGQSNDIDVASRLRDYLEGGGDFRRYELAWRIADIFDQYLLFRPDWVDAWEGGRLCDLGADEAWQAALWRDLALHQAHRGRLMKQLSAHLDGDEFGGALPERVILFGISTLPPLFLDMMRKLARHIPVHLFALNPSRKHWEEIRGQVRPAATDNPLLASLDQQGRDFCAALADIPELQDVFDETPGSTDTLLHILQSDIVNLIDPEAPGYVRHHILPDDRSVQVHNCHGPMREVEVLHDQLLQLFSADPSLTPDRVAVLAADIESYVPYINAVFAARAGAPAIHYNFIGRGSDA